MTSSRERAVGFFPSGTFVLGIAGCFLAGNLTVLAAPIKRAHHTAQHVPAQIQAFDAYLNGGPAHWQSSHLMKVPSGVHVRSADGTLKDNLAVDYVMWVRDRHPIAFDRNHPTLGHLLEAAQAERGTEFFVFTPKNDKAAESESIHAMSTSTPVSSSSLEAQVLEPPRLPLVFPTPTSAIVQSSGISQVAPAPQAAVLQAQQILAETPEPSPVLTTLLLFGSVATWKYWKDRGLRGAKPVLSESIG